MKKKNDFSKIYERLVGDEISFAKATGYDRELTAVVPLSELARREEERLRDTENRSDFLRKIEQSDQPELPVGPIIQVLRAAKTVEEVAGVLVEIVSNLVARVLLFWERNQTLYGFASKGMGLEEVKLLTLEMPTVLLEKITGQELLYNGFSGLPCQPAEVKRFFEIIGLIPKEILVVPIYVTPKDRWILYADNGASPLCLFELRLVEVVASRAGALADLLMEGEL